MKRRQAVSAFFLLSFLATAGGVSAETNVADFVRRVERTTEDQQTMSAYYRHSRDIETAKAARPLVVHSAKAESTSPELTFEVKEIRVSTSRILTEEEIQKAIHFKGAGSTTVSELQAMVDRLNALYIAKKIPTAQAVLPPQTVRDGIVFIRLIEGVYGKVEITGNKRISEASIRHRIRAKVGELVDVERLQDELVRYNSTNVYQIRAELLPGETEGTSDLHLALDEKENPLSSFLFVDNAGQHESGRTRIGMYSEYRGIGGHDAAIFVTPVWTRGIWGGSVGMDMPIGTRGTRASISFSRNLVDIIRGVFKDGKMKANSNDLALVVTHPLKVTTFSKVDLFVEAHRKNSGMTSAGLEVSDDEAKTAKLGLSARKFDDHGVWFFSGAATAYDGDDHFRDIEKNGVYYSAYALRRQNLPKDQYLSLRLAGQYTARKGLPTTEQFSLGGMASVRGFKESALSGDRGWLAGIEYGFPISADHRTWRGLAFFDYGVAINNFSLYTQRDDLGGAGLGVEYAKGGWYAKAIVGFPLIDSAKKAAGDSCRIHFYVQRSI